MTLTPEHLQPPGALLLAPEWLMLPEGPKAGMAVVVEGGRFTHVGPVAELQVAHPGLTAVTLPQRLLMPGLVDTHTHLTQAFGKALAFGEPSEIFRRIWVPMEGVLDADAAYLSTKLASLEALRGGFTTVVDAGTRSDAGLDGVMNATRDAGIRCVLGMICNDIGNEDGEAGVRRISLATSLYRAAMTGLVEAAREIRAAGTFGYVDDTMTSAEFVAHLTGG
jgi:cytosine/adenosine deaminase-related metal-dependent hydrolase